MGEMGSGGDGEEKIGYKLIVMIKRLIFLTLISVLFLQPVMSAESQESFVRFVGKPNSKVFLEVAVTDAEKEKGLMNRPSLAENRGMVFIFRPAKQITFWMKDTLISLDMIFVNKGKIVKIARNTVPNQTTTIYPSGLPVTEVIEVNGGFADRLMIKAGDRLVFKNIPQIDYSVKSMNK